MLRHTLVIGALLASTVGALAQTVPGLGPPTGIAGAYNAAPPTITAGQAGWVQLDVNGNLKVNVAAGGASGGTSSTFGAAFPPTGTAIGFSDGVNMVAGTVDGSGFLKVNCSSGCAGGTFNNNSDNVATSATNGQSAAWAYVWDGATWDRLYGDSTNGAFVNVKTSVLPTGAATSALQSTINTTLGSPFQAGGSIGNTTFAATQAVAASLNATVVGTGTFATQAAQSGAWTVQPGNTANTTPWLATIAQGGNSATVSASGALKVDGSAVTQPVSGTVTANAGTGTFATSNAALALAQGSTTSGQTGPLIQGAVTTTAPTYTTAQTSPLSLDTAGGLRVSIIAGGGSGGTASTFGAPFPATGTAIGLSDGVNMVAALADGSGNLKVNCASGCAGGSFNNNADNVATSATNGQAAAWAYVWDGSAWDRLYSATSALNSTGTGLGTAQAIGQCDDTSPTGISENSFGNMRIDCTDRTLAIGAMATTTAPSYTTATIRALSLTTNGALRTDLSTISGTSAVTGSGTVNGALRVELGNNGTGRLATVDTVTAVTTVSTVTNLSQMNGAALLMGNGATGTGSQRVTIASDNSAVAGMGAGATATAVPANAVYTGLSDGTNLRGWLNAATGLNSTGAGVGTAQVVGQCDDTTPTPLTENSFGNGRIDCTDHTLAVGGLVTTAAPSYTTATARGLSLTTGGGLRTDIATFAGTAAVTGSGTATGALRVEVANNGTGLITTNPAAAANWAIGATAAAVPGNVIYAGLSDGTNLRGWLNAANSLNSSTGQGLGTAQIVGQCDDTTPTGLSENSFGNGRIDCNTHAVVTTPTPSATAGGTTLYTLTLANSTNATNVKASAGQVYSISGFNLSSAAPVFISLYNTAGTPTCGTSIIQQFMIPGNTTGAGFVYDFAMPKGFATGIAFCATTGIAGTGSVVASNYVLNIDYK